MFEGKSQGGVARYDVKKFLPKGYEDVQGKFGLPFAHNQTKREIDFDKKGFDLNKKRDPPV